MKTIPRYSDHIGSTIYEAVMGLAILAIFIVGFAIGYHVGRLNNAADNLAPRFLERFFSAQEDPDRKSENALQSVAFLGRGQSTA